MIENGWYLACPRCYKLSKGEDWIETFITYHRTQPAIDRFGRVINILREQCTEMASLEALSSTHNCVDGKQRTLQEGMDCFRIYVEKGYIFKASTYFKMNSETLDEIAMRNGLKISKKITYLD